MQTTIFKLWLLAWTALGILVCLGLQSGCKSPQAGAPTRVASRTNSPLNQGAAAAVFQDSAKGDSAALATIPTSCPVDPEAGDREADRAAPAAQGRRTGSMEILRYSGPD